MGYGGESAYANQDAERKKIGEDVAASFPLRTLVYNPPQLEWFGIVDLLHRSMLSIVLFYYLLFTRPIDFFRFTIRWNMGWYTPIPGLIFTCCYPFIPLAFVAVTAIEYVRDLF